MNETPMPTLLRALQFKHVYGGTVDPEVKRERRNKNKTAKRSRKLNRKKR